MNTRGLTRWSKNILFITCLMITMLLIACQPARVSVSQPPAQSPAQPEATALPELPPAVEPTTVAAQPTEQAADDQLLDISGLAKDQTFEVVAVVPPGGDGPWWGAAPEHRLITLYGYPVYNNPALPQIFIYPTADMADYEAIAQQAASLKALLETRQPEEKLPFLPLTNGAQAMRVKVDYLEFKNGTGVRYLTQFNQGISPINNAQMLYTFQGLTSDGQYYVAAVLPVTHAELPSDWLVQSPQLSDYTAYMEKITAWLEEQPGDSLTPSLDALDAAIQSLEVK